MKTHRLETEEERIESFQIIDGGLSGNFIEARKLSEEEQEAFSHPEKMKHWLMKENDITLSIAIAVVVMEQLFKERGVSFWD